MYCDHLIQTGQGVPRDDSARGERGLQAHLASGPCLGIAVAKAALTQEKEAILVLLEAVSRGGAGTSPSQIQWLHTVEVTYHSSSGRGQRWLSSTQRTHAGRGAAILGV